MAGGEGFRMEGLFEPGRYAMGEIAGRCWRLHVACDACGHGVLWGAEEIAAKFPAQASPAAVLARLKCRCGSRRGRALFTQDTGAAARRDVARFEAEVESGKKRIQLPRV